MIVCVSMNPSMDKALTTPAFSPDAPNRVTVERLDLGGKGVNVARTLAALGEKTAYVGFDYRGAPVRKGLADWPIALHTVPLDGELRTNIKLRDEKTGGTIEINERGAAVTKAQLDALGERLLALCGAGDYVIFSGSMPPGVPMETYRDWCRAVRAHGALPVVDCDGAALALALEAAPALIKPNAQEFFALTGACAEADAQALEACRGLHARGVGMVCLSRGPKGALLSVGGAAYACPAADVPVRGVQGAGDAMLSGLVAALRRGETPPAALRYASAVAGAAVMRAGTQTARAQDVEALLPQLSVRAL